MAARFNSVRVGHGEAMLLITVLACFLGGVDPFGGHGRVVPVVLALIILQVLSSGLNLIGANQHLATAVWGPVPDRGHGDALRTASINFQTVSSEG